MSPSDSPFFNRTDICAASFTSSGLLAAGMTGVVWAVVFPANNATCDATIVAKRASS